MEILPLGSDDMDLGPLYRDEAAFSALLNPDTLLVRVESVDPELMKPVMEDLSLRSGLDAYTLRQKLIGFGLAMLAENQVPNLSGLTDGLREYGIPTLPINRRALFTLPTPPRTQTVQLDGHRLVFLGRTRETVFEFEPGDTVLAVLADLSGQHAAKELSRTARRNSPARREADVPQSAEESVLRGEPVLVLFSNRYPEGTALTVTGINYGDLGTYNQKSARANLRWLLATLRRHAETFHLDTHYGLTNLPGLEPPPDKGRWMAESDARERLLTVVGKYAHTARLAFVQGLFREWAPDSVFHPERLRERVAQKEQSGTMPTKEEAKAISDQARPTRHDSWKFVLDQSVKRLGPPKLVWGFTGLILLCAVVSVLSRNPVFFALGAGIASLGQLSLAVVQWKRKRLIEDLPTSKLNSLAMGLVEVTGMVTPVVPVFAPYSGVECVACSYSLQRLEHWGSQPGEKGWRTVRSGTLDCGLFWIKDEHGQCLVDSKDLIWDMHVTHTMHGGLSPMPIVGVSGMPLGLGPDERATETFLAAGATVYLVGIAERRTFSPNETVDDRFRRHLRALKQDRDKLMAYDLDDNGLIDEEEWAMARDAARNQAELEHAVSDAPQEAVVIRAGERDGFFYLSDEGEASVLGRITANMVLRWVVGLLLAGLSGYHLTDSGTMFFEKLVHDLPAWAEVLSILL